MMSKEMEVFRNGVKLVALYQATLEQMDVMKGTVLYRHDIKSQMKRLEAKIERIIEGPLKALDEADEQMMTTIQHKAEMILDLSLEELAGLRLAVDDHRNGEQ
jgi:phage terminase small subunit